MSQENVETLSRQLEQFNRTGEVLPEIYDSDAEWIVAREDPDATTHRGVAAIRDYFAQWAEMFEAIEIRAEKVIDPGDKVFSWIQFAGKGVASGALVEMEFAYVWTFREGKVVRVEEYFDHAEALAAVGLSEQDAHADS
jgi:ketosteroid isomerase-like protein